MDQLDAAARSIDAALDTHQRENNLSGDCARRMDEIRASIQNILDAEFPRCAVIQAERHPLSSMARCRSHGTHLLSAEACEMAIHAVPFRSALGPECRDQIWEYQFLPPSVALIADKIKVTPLEWRRAHPCRAPSCPLFVLEDGSCIDPQCSSMSTCPGCAENTAFDGGRDHMTCVNCGFQWCRLCRSGGVG